MHRIRGRLVAVACVVLTAMSSLFALQADLAAALPGVVWVGQTAPSGAVSVAYGNGLFVAVDGTRVMTSPDGANWTARAFTSNGLDTVTYGNGQFVAVGTHFNGPNTLYTTEVATSPNGVTWTEHSAPGGGATAVTYGNGLYVATVGDVITSPDGVTWTERSVPTANLWYSVTYGNGVFVAVGNAGGTYQVMTSPDGITWTDRATLEADTWVSVAYGNGTFVAVGDGSSFPSVGGHEVMTSPDGVTWTMRTGAEYAVWVSVTYGGGAFVAVGRALDATHHEVMTSTDGATWTAQAQAENNNWEAVTYGNNLFVAVAHTTFGHPVMTSTAGTTFSYTTNWTVPETARLAQMSAYFQQPAEQVQRTCVAFVDFLLRIANPPIPPSHVPPPSLFGPTAVTSSWTSADIGFLHDVQAQYSLSPEAAQKLATGLVSFFLALGGH